jgi:shikimate kinase
LARRLRLPFTDTDREVEQRTGLTVADIFLTHGEAQFRAWERQAARDAIVGRGPAVVALGGGAPLDNATAQLMAGHFTVYLQVSAAQAIRRVGLSETRPLLASSPRARWRELMAQREPVYRRLATVVIATDVGRPAALAAQIAKLWAQGAINEGAKL